MIGAQKIVSADGTAASIPCNDDNGSSSYGDSDFSSDSSQDTDSDVTEDLASEDESQASCDPEYVQEPTKSVQDSKFSFQYSSGFSIDNTTEKAITRFERFIFPEWPAGANDEALEMLRQQLEHCGGFCAEMKLIDLSTPENVRFDIEEVLELLKHKISDRVIPINSVETFVLPNVKKLTSGEAVKNMLGDYCGAFCGENTTIKEVVLRCDEISDDFVAGDLEWVKGFFSCYSMDRVIIFPAKVKNKEYKRFCKRLRVCNKSNYLERTSLLKKRPPQDTSSRVCSEVNVTSGCDNDELIEKPNSKLCSTILWDLWKTDKLHSESIDGKGVTIAFLDSGINIAHKAFMGRIVAVNDITCCGSIDLTTDRSGHGTLCASIACGAAFKSTGQPRPVPAGVAPGANIVVYKITGSAGKADATMITKALKQCLDDKERYRIDIVLLPYGSNNLDCRQIEAVCALISKGVHVVTASGNNGEWEEISYPARSGHTLCVGAHDKHGNITPYTSKGRALDFTAPGVDLTGASSVHPSMFTTGGGTSFAAACAAGLLALIIQRARDIAASNTKQFSAVKPSINYLVHNQDVIKKVLINVSKHSSDYLISHGYGCLKPTAMLLNGNKLVELLYEDILKE